jgi:hypothetical protein
MYGPSTDDDQEAGGVVPLVLQKPITNSTNRTVKPAAVKDYDLTRRKMIHLCSFAIGRSG